MIAAPEIVSGMSGESEAKIRGLFNDAAAKASYSSLIQFRNSNNFRSFNRHRALYLSMRSTLLRQSENKVAKLWRRVLWLNC